MKDNRIERAEVFVVAPDVERYTWAEGMSEQYMANIILKLTTAGGLEGIAGAAMISSHTFDRSVGETLRWVLPNQAAERNHEQRDALLARLDQLGKEQT